MQIKHETTDIILSVFGQEIVFFKYGCFFLPRGLFLKSTDTRFLLSKIERLTPNIDKDVVNNVHILKPEKPLNCRFYLDLRISDLKFGRFLFIRARVLFL